MLKRRITALERRFRSVGGSKNRNFRLVYQFDGDPEPEQGPDEDLLVVHVVNTRGDDAGSKLKDKRVLRFDFGSGEDHTEIAPQITHRASENPQPTKREKTTK